MSKLSIFRRNLRYTLLCVALAAVFCAGFSVQGAYAATEYTYGDFSYIIDTGFIEITQYNGSDADVVIPNTITHEGTEYKVRSIGKSAFKGKTGLSSIVIPENVAEIGNRAFEDCVKLSSVTINGTIDKVSGGNLSNPFINAGTDTKSITVTFGNGVKKVPANLFRTNKNYDSGNGEYARVTKVVMSDSIQTIGDSAFNGCYDLKDVVWGTGLTSIEQDAFNGTAITDVVLPAGLTSLGNRAFEDCVNLKSIAINGTIDKVSGGNLSNPFINAGTETKSITVTFGNGVKKVPTNLFCTNKNYDSGNGKYARVTKVVLPDSIETIGDSAFDGCYDLTDVVWGSGLTSIGQAAFNETAITSVVLPAGLTSLGNNAFTDCVNLSSIAINGTIDKVSAGNLSNPFINAGAKSRALTVTFGSAVTKVAESLFDTNKKYESGSGSYAHVTKVVLSDGITTIGDSAFDGCYDLKEVTFGNAVNKIGAYAFRDCNHIQSVSLPHSLKQIGESGFYGTSSLNTVYYDGLKSDWGSVVTASGNDDFLKASFHYNIAYAPVSVANCYYNGKAQTPAVTVTDGEAVLAEGVDYAAAYSNNIEVGTATVTIEGKGAYFGKTSASFQIKKKETGTKASTSAGSVVITSESKTVALTKAKNRKSVTVPATVKINGKTYKVTQINAKAFTGSKIRTITIGKNVKVIRKNAFKGSKATKLILKTKKLTKKSVKGCLKGSRIKTVKVKVSSKKSTNRTYVKKYKKIFTKKNAGKKVTVK